MGFMAYAVYLTLIGPIFMLKRLILFALGFLVKKKNSNNQEHE